MNKFDEYLYEYINQNRELSIENTGRFYTGSAVADSETTIAAIPGTLQFLANKKAVTDEVFIDFLAAKIGKSRMLIASDFSSYMDQVRSFINIGKPFEIPGIGIIKAGNSGMYEFSPSTGKPEFTKTPSATQQRSRKSAKSSTTGKGFLKFITAAIIIVVVGGLAWGAYSLFIKNSKWAENVGNFNKDTVSVNTNNGLDSAGVNSNIAPIPVQLNANDSVSCKYIQEITPSMLRAKSRTQKLNDFGYIAGYDSTGNKGFRIFTIHASLVKDTLHFRDSLQKNFQKNILCLNSSANFNNSSDRNNFTLKH